MNFLLDTHALLWFLTKDSKLPPFTHEIISNSENMACVSTVSYWEIAIKYSLGRLDLKSSLQHLFELINQTEFTKLPISEQHILQSAKLPFHHGDSFDRMIIAQALIENFAIVTKDRQFTKYDVQIVWDK